ncbi:MAG TPA: PQQ-binding-like beta-propeller repeat protein [Gemmatimonadaceae bacterium]|nr:PQQ-binding-like beta-propeller repeat protein [Gemmatimonadaceae bacterium]
MRTVLRPAYAVAIATGALSCSPGPLDPTPVQGKLLWTVDVAGTGEPAFDGETVYFGGWANEVIAVEASTGRVRWRSPTGGYSPRTQGGLNVVLAGDVVVIGDMGVAALDRRTGASRWFYDPVPLGEEGERLGESLLATDGQRIFTGSSTGHVFALDVSTGRPAWRVQLITDGNSRLFDPLVSGGAVYIYSRTFTNPLHGAVYALDAGTGAVRWSRAYPYEPTKSRSPNGPMTLAQGLLMFPLEDGEIQALDVATGETRWTAPRPDGVTGRDDWRFVLAVRGTLIATSLSSLVTGYDVASGQQRWQVPLSESSVLHPLTTDGTHAFVLALNGHVHAFDPATGQVDQRWAPPAELFIGPARPVPGALYIAGSRGLYAFRR